MLMPGIDDHVMEQQPIITADATVKSNHGPVILIANESVCSHREGPYYSLFSADGILQSECG